MKYFIVMIFLGLTSFVCADDFVTYSTTTNRAIKHFESLSQGPRGSYVQFSKGTEARTIRSLIKSIGIKYLKQEGGNIVEVTQSERNAIDALDIVNRINSIRQGAKDQLNGFNDLPLMLRAFADILKDEINILRGWTINFKAEAAAATNLADFQARIAALPDLDDRTLQQLRTSLENRIDSGNVD